MSKPYNITGLKGLHPRLEIRDLAKDEVQFTLFINALDTIKQPDYRPKPARFQELGGIHGLPYEKWSGDPEAPDSMPNGIWGGYCNHQSVLFPVWHRPYVLSVEQSIGEAAIRLAKRWTEDTEHVDEATRAKWIDAAERLRFPFWDWTSQETLDKGLPDVLKPQVFQFTLPDGTKTDPIENPLSFHRFGNVQPDGFKDQIFKTSMQQDQAMSYFKSWTRTYRWPSSNVSPIEDYVKINALLQGGEKDVGSVRQLRSQIGNLFCYPAPGETEEHQRPSIWDEFSNSLFTPDKAGWDGYGCGSIEIPHNKVHLVVGGLGDMANNDYAGFDPIFYLHHCNIDRILAFWEYTYNKFWVAEGYYKKGGDGKPIPFTQPEGTWDEANNADINENSELQPFRTASGDYWKPKDTRFPNKPDTLHTGYTYPDIVATVNGEERRVSLSNPLPESDEKVHECKATIQAHFGVLEKHSIGNLTLIESHAAIPKGHGIVPNYRRFYTFVELVNHAFSGSYSLQLLYKDKVVGTFDVLTRSDATQCASCRIRRKAGGHVRGVIDIPDEVVEDIIQSQSENIGDSPEVETIADAIKSQINVRLVNAGGNILADAVGQPGVPGLGSQSAPGTQLEATIRPVMRLGSAQAGRKLSTKLTMDGPASKLGITYFNHASHGEFLVGDREWKSV
ncbi:hypothetical protein D9611_006959 [Ephemerocybe angulata]|uniref:tyrosinase n=1 Tax=Ephemerocybe angulata TaxID=980116 RepID=A0A8H5EVZ1_9AGAR|nr:hypothetical protein D9611_006959 [Tulosesus angulatus]